MTNDVNASPHRSVRHVFHKGTLKASRGTFKHISTLMAEAPHRQAVLQVLCWDGDAIFRNEVISALAANVAAIRLPKFEAGSATGVTAFDNCLVEVTCKGRTALCELFVATPGGKLVAIHYTKLLSYASLEALLAVASKVERHMMLKTQSMLNSRPGPPPSQALAALRGVVRHVKEQQEAAAAAATAAPCDLSRSGGSGGYSSEQEQIAGPEAGGDCGFEPPFGCSMSTTSQQSSMTLDMERSFSRYYEF